MSKQERAFELFAEGLGPKDARVLELGLKPESIRKYYRNYQDSLSKPSEPEPVEPVEPIEDVEPIEPRLIRAMDAEIGSDFVATIPGSLDEPPRKVTLRKISQLGIITRCLQITPRLGISIPGTSLVKPI